MVAALLLIAVLKRKHGHGLQRTYMSADANNLQDGCWQRKQLEPQVGHRPSTYVVLKAN